MHNFRSFFSLNCKDIGFFLGGGLKDTPTPPTQNIEGAQLPRLPLLPKPMHLTGFNQAHTKDFYLRRVQFFKSGSLPDFLNVGIFAKILEFFFFFLPQRVQI